MSGENLVLETKMFNLSTRGSSCNILNTNPEFKSLAEFNIPNMIERDESIEYIQFSVPNAVIPVSFFIINNTNCQLDVIENGVAATYKFEYGNYNSNFFMNAFKALLGTNWSISLNNFNSVFTISNSIHSFNLLGTSTIDSIIGFSDTLVSVVNNNINTVTLIRCCNFLPLPRITLRCAELANTNMVGQNSTADVIITIPNNARPNGQIYYQNNSQAKLLFRHHELTRFIIAFTNDDGDLLNFNGISSFFTLQFDIFRKFVPKPPRFNNIVEFVNNKNFASSLENNSMDDNI
jgi:hypothetical protein